MFGKKHLAIDPLFTLNTDSTNDCRICINVGHGYGKSLTLSPLKAVTLSFFLLIVHTMHYYDILLSISIIQKKNET